MYQLTQDMRFSTGPGNFAKGWNHSRYIEMITIYAIAPTDSRRPARTSLSVMPCAHVWSIFAVSARKFGVHVVPYNYM